jgi:hypothetical protein
MTTSIPMVRLLNNFKQISFYEMDPLCLVKPKRAGGVGWSQTV